MIANVCQYCGVGHSLIAVSSSALAHPSPGSEPCVEFFRRPLPEVCPLILLNRRQVRLCLRSLARRRQLLARSFDALT